MMQLKSSTLLKQGLETPDCLVFCVMKWEVNTNSLYFSVKFVDCQEIKCYQDWLSSVMNLGFSLWKGAMMENLQVPT